MLSPRSMDGFCGTRTAQALRDGMTATLQAVSIRKGIVQESSKGKTTEKEISPLVLQPGAPYL